MYRRYEDPTELEEELKELEAEYKKIPLTPENENRLISLSESIAELKDRIRFAWDDDEYDTSDADAE